MAGPLRTGGTVPVDFALPSSLEAHEPPEARGLARDGVRLLVGEAAAGPRGHRFTDLPAVLRPGDLLVVNTSATLPATVPVRGRSLTVHFSTELAPDRWLVELRRDRARGRTPAGPRDGATGCPARPG